jgi:hypothetical protein
MTLELIFGVEMGFPFYAKVESFCLLAAMMMMMRSVCVSLDPASKISLSLTIFEALVKNPKRGKKKKKTGGKSKFRLFVCFFYCCKKKEKSSRERERERKVATNVKREREREEKKIEKVANFVVKDGAPGEEEGFFVVSENCCCCCCCYCFVFTEIDSVEVSRCSVVSGF